MKYAYFPGCSASSTGISYTLSYDFVARCCGIDLQEIPDWNCCGASAAHAASELLGDALPARSLALSEAVFGDMSVLAPCAGCYQHLKVATEHARSNNATRTQIETIIERPWSASADVVNGLEPFLDEAIQQRISSHVCHSLEGLKVACYYGCALVRPADICNFDDDENPQSMETLIALSGATPVSWSFKNECCGASHQVALPQAGRSMVRRILENAVLSGADAIACACPLCMLNLDMREAAVNAQRAKEGKEPLDVPIYYFTELLAASFGASPAKVGLDRHFHPAAKVHERAYAGWVAQQREEAERKEREKAQRAAKRAAKKPAKKPAAAKATKVAVNTTATQELHSEQKPFSTNADEPSSQTKPPKPAQTEVKQ